MAQGQGWRRRVELLWLTYLRRESAGDGLLEFVLGVPADWWGEGQGQSVGGRGLASLGSWAIAAGYCE